jgi:hypothetical protein
LATHLKRNHRAILAGRPVEYFVYYVADSYEDADHGRETFTKMLAGKFPTGEPTVADC